MARQTPNLPPLIKSKLESRGLATQIKVLATVAGIESTTLTGNLAGGKPMSLNTALKIIRALRENAEIQESGEIELLEELDSHQQKRQREKS